MIFFLPFAKKAYYNNSIDQIFMLFAFYSPGLHSIKETFIDAKHSPSEDLRRILSNLERLSRGRNLLSALLSLLLHPLGPGLGLQHSK